MNNKFKFTTMGKNRNYEKLLQIFEYSNPQKVDQCISLLANAKSETQVNKAIDKFIKLKTDNGIIVNTVNDMYINMLLKNCLAKYRLKGKSKRKSRKKSKRKSKRKRKSRKIKT